MKNAGFFGEDSKPKLADHELMVYVWLPASDNNSIVGHVSLETSKIYASLWPKEPSWIKKSNSKEGMTYNDDLIKEKRPPDHSIKLISLDVDAINTAYDQFKSANKNWRTTGHRSIKEFLFTTGKEFDDSINNMEFENLNCSCLVYLLLKQGGIDEFVNERQKTFGAMIVGYAALGLVAGLATANPFIGVAVAFSASTLGQEYDRSKTFFTPKGILRLLNKAQAMEMNNEIKNDNHLRAQH